MTFCATVCRRSNFVEQLYFWIKCEHPVDHVALPKRAVEQLAPNNYLAHEHKLITLPIAANNFLASEQKLII